MFLITTAATVPENTLSTIKIDSKKLIGAQQLINNTTNLLREGDSTISLKEWLIYRFTELIPQDTQTIGFHTWMNRIAAIYLDKIKQSDTIVELFGNNCANSSAYENLTTLIPLVKYLSEYPELSNVYMGQIYRCPMNKETIKDGYNHRLQQIQSILLIFDKCFKENIKKPCVLSERIKKHGSQISAKLLENSIAFLIPLRKIYSIKMKEVDLCFHEALNENNSSSLKLSYLKRAVTIMKMFSPLFINNSKNVSLEFINAQNLLPLYKKEKREIAEKKDQKLKPIAIPMPYEEISIDLNNPDDLVEACRKTGVTTNREEAKTALKGIKETVQKQEQVTNKIRASLTPVQIQTMKKIYSQLIDCEDITSSIGEAACFLCAVRESLEDEIDIIEKEIQNSVPSDLSWIDLLDEYSPPKKVKAEMQKESEDLVLPSSSSSNEDMPIEPSLEVIDAHERLGIHLFELVQGSSVKEQTFTASIEWIISSVIKKYPQELLAHLDTDKQERITIAQKDAKEHAFLFFCALEIMNRAVAQKNILSLLSSMQSCVFHAYTALEQLFFIQHILNFDKIPHRHNLVTLAKGVSSLEAEERGLLSEIEEGLIWFRYPNHARKKIKEGEKVPLGLQVILSGDALLKKVIDGEPITEHDKETIKELSSFLFSLEDNFKTMFLKLSKEPLHGQLVKDLLNLHTKQRITKRKHLENIPPQSKTELNKKLLQTYRLICEKEGTHLKEVQKHLRYLLAICQYSPLNHLKGWKNQEMLHIQWAIEQLYQHGITKNDIDVLKTHTFSRLHKALKSIKALQGKDIRVPHDALYNLSSFNYERAVHYPRLGETLANPPINLKNYVASLKAARKSVHAFEETKMQIYTFEKEFPKVADAFFQLTCAIEKP